MYFNETMESDLHLLDMIDLLIDWSMWNLKDAVWFFVTSSGENKRNGFLKKINTA